MRLLRFGPKGPKNRDCWMAPVGSAICRATSGHHAGRPRARQPQAAGRPRPVEPAGGGEAIRASVRRSRRAELHLHRPELRRPRRGSRAALPSSRSCSPNRSARSAARTTRSRFRAARRRPTGGRARRGDRRASYVPANRLLCGLLRGERRLGARVPARARRHLVQGQEFGDLRPVRPMAGDQGRGPDPHNLNLWLEVDGHRYQFGRRR